MPITHRYVSPVAGDGNSNDVQTSDWNASHAWGLAPVSYSANATVPNTAEFIKGTGGGSGITLTTPSAAANAQLVQTYKKVDAGAGVVMLQDPAGATIDGQVGYQLMNQFQFVTILSDGVTWHIMGQN